MGTYTYLALKNKKEHDIQILNLKLHSLGVYKGEWFNSVFYGAFITREKLREEARFMNEDEEGLKQCTHIKRPITVEWIGGMFWNRIGFCVEKLSGGTDNKTLMKLAALSRYCLQHKLLNLQESSNYLPEFIESYISEEVTQ